MARNSMRDVNGPLRVVILGGGPAGVAAAYWLSAPEQKGRYAVTLYTQGWRLGGKCASGRNKDEHERIEEHGLHMFMGCYENAFATLRSCYQEWREIKRDPANPLQSWTDAFLPQRHVSLMDRDGPGGAWQPWNFDFPQLPGEPGDGSPAESGNALILRMSDWLDAYVPDSAPFKAAVHTALQRLREVLRGGPDHDPESAEQALREAQRDIARSQAAGVGADPAGASTLRRCAVLACLGLAAGLGYLRDIFGKGRGAYDALNSQDLRAWLGNYCLWADALAAAPLRGFYDLIFAALGTDQNWKGSIAAGVSLRAQLEMALGYRNAPLWKMAAGTGDTVFTPFYDVLMHRGVGIEFFSRVAALHPGDDGRLAEIDVTVQAVTVGGAPYRPLRRVNELDCWPNQPDWDQLVNGKALHDANVDFEASYCTVSVGAPKPLRVDRDFDLAILAMPPDSLQLPVTALAAKNPDWARALQASACVSTLALQLWMQPDLRALGWCYGTTVLTAFAEALDSWGDMSHLIPREAWTGVAPQTIAYFCGRLQLRVGEGLPGEIRQAARFAADDWLRASLRGLWPAAPPGCLSRYDGANFDLSDRYVATPAGDNVVSRFDPEQPAGFRNLYVVGDWTRTRFSGGCFESAIESAMLAARGISGFPQNIKTA
jgi:uncharacterized protein with NAD-binding domain and iron-sulfur cluster